MQRPLLLAKILGIYTVGFKNTKTGNSKRLDVVVMENLLCGCRSQKVRELQGLYVQVGINMVCNCKVKVYSLESLSICAW